MKSCKKTTVIQATQWFKIGDHPNVEPLFYNDLKKLGLGWINGHIVTPGKYVVTSVTGEQYPCKFDSFEMTYEAAK
jgi:hypothetical protein